MNFYPDSDVMLKYPAVIRFDENIVPYVHLRFERV